MRVILLAAGLGSRLKPLTDKVPKCLVPIGGKPLLQIWLERLVGAGFGPFLINTHYLHNQVEEFIKSSPYAGQILLSYESELLGTAGSVKKNIDFFQGNDGLILHADNYCLVNLQNFRAAHFARPNNCELTMLTFRSSAPESCGIVEVNQNNVVTTFHEKIKTPPGNLANGAIYIFSSNFIKNYKLNFNDAKDLSLDVIAKSIGRIYSYESEKLLIDIGTPKMYMQANQYQNNINCKE